MRYQVDTHAHTLASTHAYSTIHDYIAEAKRKGIIIFAITDHGPEMADDAAEGAGREHRVGVQEQQ